MSQTRAEIDGVPGATATDLRRTLVERVSFKGFQGEHLWTADGVPIYATLLALGSDEALSGRPWASVRHRVFRARADEAAMHTIRPSEWTSSGNLATLIQDASSDLSTAAPLPDQTAEAIAVARELVTNALVHRGFDEQTREQPVEIDLFTDGFVIRSPGATLRTTSPTGASPNPVLHALAKALGLACQQGHGLQFVRQACRKIGWTVRTHVEEHAHAVTVRVDPALVEQAQSEQQRLRLPAGGADALVRAHLRRVPRTAHELTNATGLPPTTVRASLKRLVDSGVASRTHPKARSRLQAYFLSDR